MTQTNDTNTGAVNTGDFNEPKPVQKPGEHDDTFLVRCIHWQLSRDFATSEDAMWKYLHAATDAIYQAIMAAEAKDFDRVGRFVGEIARNVNLATTCRGETVGLYFMGGGIANGYGSPGDTKDQASRIAGNIEDLFR